jgi:hypothetical protein
MVKHLDHEYELTERPSDLIFHFWDTIDAIGGWKGIAALFLFMCVFYGIVVYTIENSRRKRQEKRLKKQY